MPESIKTTDFLVTFISLNNAVTKRLSDIIKNRNNKLFREALKFPESFVVPFFSESSVELDVVSTKYFLEEALDSAYHAYINAELCKHHLIQDGDYSEFKNTDGKVEFCALFTATSSVKLGYKKYAVKPGVEFYIGKDESNTFCFENVHMYKEKHIVIKADKDGNVCIKDLKNGAGVYVNGKQINYSSRQLNLLDEIFIMGMSIVNFDSFIAVRDLAINTELPPLNSFVKKQQITVPAKNYFVRTPRIVPSLDFDTIEIDAPPAPPSIDKTPAILQLGPGLTMAMVMVANVGVMTVSNLGGGNILSVISSSIMAGGILIGVIVWPKKLRKHKENKYEEDKFIRVQKYTAYISKIESRLTAQSERTLRLLNDNFNPSPEHLCTFLDNENMRFHLWKRSFNDNDFLRVRLGLGQRSFDVKVKTPKQSFQLHDDELFALPAQIAEKFSRLSNAPITLDLMNNKTTGIIGNNTNVRKMVDRIIINITALHSYDEVKLIIVSPETEYESNYYNYVKNIPHIWSNDKKLRYFATTNDEVHTVFNAINEIVKERDVNTLEKPATVPYFVFVILNDSLTENESLLRYIENPDNTVGIVTLFAYGDVTKLPKSCRTVIYADDNRGSYYSRINNDNILVEFESDNLPHNKIDLFMKKLSSLPVKVDARSLSIPDRISFLQMYKAGNIAELDIEKNWSNNNSSKTLAVPIGVMAGGVPFLLDIHEDYHGCHGLIAGTTGSGKSEFLQALVLSMAVNYSPKEVAFVIVDFKGGDMARPFMEKETTPALPHLAATISNLSGNVMHRALVSLEAEIKSRQRLIDKAAKILGVDKLDINSYQRHFKARKLSDKLPHLIIIIDEFAQLKKQFPNFLEKLIDVAQVGRSLGIHLILATQKPSGVVDPQIWSNSRFKICLRVADVSDSKEMIGRPDSAFIKNAGRCYVQVGYDEVFECVQSGYSGAEYVSAKKYMPDDEITVQLTDNTATSIYSEKDDLENQRTHKSQLEAIVAEMVTIAVNQDKDIFVERFWKDLLPEKVFLDKLRKDSRSLLCSCIGLVDYIKIREQEALTVDFEKIGHVAVFGANSTGKTTFLQTVIYSMVCGYGYTPDELHIYAMDLGGRNLGYLSNLPHTGDVVFEGDNDKIAGFATLLQNIIDDRKHLFETSNCGTFSAYNSIDKTNDKEKLPAVLVLIDNYSPLLEKYTDVSYRIIDIISSCRAYGIYFIITGSVKSEIHYRVLGHISTYFTFKLNDKDAYFDILRTPTKLTPDDVKGRGLTVIDKDVVEFQTALALDCNSDPERVKVISSQYRKIKDEWEGVLLPTAIEITDKVVQENAASNAIEQGGIQSTQSTPKPQLAAEPPIPITAKENTIIVGSSIADGSLYGMDFTKDSTLAVCADSTDDLIDYYGTFIKNANANPNNKVVFIDDNDALFQTPLIEANCRYIRGSVELTEYLKEIVKTELNPRFLNPGAKYVRLVFIISDYTHFIVNVIANMSDEYVYIIKSLAEKFDSPNHGIFHVCGFNVNDDGNIDVFYNKLVANAKNYVLCPNSYNGAFAKIPNVPRISDVSPTDRILCQGDRNAKIALTVPCGGVT